MLQTKIAASENGVLTIRNTSKKQKWTNDTALLWYVYFPYLISKDNTNK